MKAKLIKTDKDNYILVDSTKGVYDKGYLIGSSRESDVNKLSKQNCDEVFGVVDVEKLADDMHESYPDWAPPVEHYDYSRGVVDGFNKAMELNKDKLFTEEDVRKAYIYGVSNCHSFGHSAIDHTNKVIQSLQQPSEIEVEIEMECCGNYSPPCNINCEYGPKLKLDSSGCLILKKI